MYNKNSRGSMSFKWLKNLLQLKKKEKFKNCESCKKKQLIDNQILMLLEQSDHLNFKREKPDTEKSYNKLRKNVSCQNCIMQEQSSFQKKKPDMQNRLMLKKKLFIKLSLNKKKVKTEKEELLLRNKTHSIIIKMIYYCKSSPTLIQKNK